MFFPSRLTMYVIIFPVHLGGGMWGLLSAPLLNKHDGILYVGDKLSFKLLGWNILGGVVIIAWSALFSSILFFTLKFFKKLKVTPEVEAKGSLSKKYVSKYIQYQPRIGINDMPKQKSLSCLMY